MADWHTFAREVHGAFSRKPVLGIDILKRQSDGKLFVIEVNAGGNVWHLSSPKEKHRIRLGARRQWWLSLMPGMLQRGL